MLPLRFTPMADIIAADLRHAAAMLIYTPMTLLR